MAPRGGNRGATGKAAKEVAAGEKAEKVSKQKESAEAEEWSKGSKKEKAGKEDKAASAEAARLRKAEAARLLEEEEKEIAKTAKKIVPPKEKAKPKPVVKAPVVPSFEDGIEDDEPKEFSASGIDNALDMLSLVTERTDKAAVGSRAASSVELHPERRFKAAFEAYKEDQLPIIKKEQPGMRLQQYENALYKQFQKSPLNPFNQVTLGYDATKDDKVAALAAIRDETARRLRAD